MRRVRFITPLAQTKKKTPTISLKIALLLFCFFVHYCRDTDLLFDLFF